MADYILLCATAFLLKKNVRKLRTAAAAGFGALFSAGMLLSGVSRLWSLLCAAAAAPVMLCIQFGREPLSCRIKSALVLFLASLASAGIGFIWLTNESRMFLSAYFPVYRLLAIFLLAIAITHFACGTIRENRLKARFLYKVCITLNGNTVTETALFDTGNFLKAPLSQISVLVAEWNAVKPLFSEETLFDALLHHTKEFSYIPCRTVGGSGGMFAFRPDAVCAEGLCFPEAIYIAITESVLDKSGSYHMLLPNTALPTLQPVRKVSL